MKKIVFFSKNLEIGGMETALICLLNKLVNDYEVTLILENKSGRLLNRLDARVKVLEYHLSTIKNVFFRKIINFAKRFGWMLKNKNKYDFSCNYATYSIIGSRLAQIASKNNSLYIHSDYYKAFKENEKQLIDFFTPHKIDKFTNIIFVSNESRSGFLTVFPNLVERCHVINNIIDYENIKCLSTKKIEENIRKDDINLLFVGRLDNSSKNISLLLKSFDLVVKKNKNFKLYIIGDGEYKTEIDKFISLNHLNENIFPIGARTNPYPYIKKCDFLILTSKYEGFPVVYLEALVLNKKILGTYMCSDETLNMRDFVIELRPDANFIAKEILNLKKKAFDYNIDFEKINEIKLKKLMDIIER